MIVSKPGNSAYHPGPPLDPTSIDTSLVQPNRRFSSLEIAEELEGSLEAPDRPKISAGYADIYHGVWTSLQGERIEVAIKEFRALIPRDRQSDPEALRKRTETIYQTACGLGHLHSQKPPICHADIKPENVLVNDQLEAALSDFGLSLVLEGLAVPSGLTTTERIKGTLNYMAGELFEGEKPNRESDVYAFGGLILTVMSGKPPFTGLREPIIMRRVIQNQPPKPEDHSELPLGDPLWSLMRCCWHQNPRLRPTMQGVLAELSKGTGDVLDLEPQPTNMMPAKLTMSPDDKAKVEVAIPEGSGKSLHVALVKIYYAPPDSTSWTYIGQEGALVLVVDKIRGGLWFKMVDLEVGKPTSCREDDANAFLEKLGDLDKYASRTSQTKDKNKPPAETKKKKAKKTEKAFKSTIGAPSRFEHVGHMSWSEDTGFSTRGVDDSWISVAESLEKFRGSDKSINANEEFIYGTAETGEAEDPEAGNKVNGRIGTGEDVSKPSFPLQSPPLVPLATTEMTYPLPQPVGRTGHARSEALASMDWPATPYPAPPAPNYQQELDDIEWIMEPIASPIHLTATQSEQAGSVSRNVNEKWTALLEALEIPSTPEKEVRVDD
ncbi:hypothetical protein FRC01_000865 [Tulasnella sp. 417]|nr:hypothetical protein FRC01_000865 [Tulasnella sp. 417]